MGVFGRLSDRRAEEEKHIAQYDITYNLIENFYKRACRKKPVSSSISFISFNRRIDSNLAVSCDLEQDGDGYCLTLEKTSGKSLPGIGGVIGEIEKINYNISKNSRDAFIQLEMGGSEDDTVFDPNNGPDVFWREIEALSGVGMTMLNQFLEK